MVLLDEGRVVAQGTHTELLATDARYAAVLAQVTSDAADDAASDTTAEAVTGE